MSNPNSELHPKDLILAPNPTGANSKMLSLDPADLNGEMADLRSIYKFLIGAILPRPIALVSTISKSGIGNLAPFSFFNGLSSNPPALSIAITYKSDGTKKDTLQNIEETGEFVVNTVSEWIAEPMNQCSADYPNGVDEMLKVGLTPEPSTQVRPARVKESPIQLECKLLQTVSIGSPAPGASTLVIGQIVMFHILDSAYKNGRIDPQFLKPIGRLAGNSYSKLGEVFDLPRPTVT